MDLVGQFCEESSLASMLLVLFKTLLSAYPFCLQPTERRPANDIRRIAGIKEQAGVFIGFGNRI
jgi:hypothetical protein